MSLFVGLTIFSTVTALLHLAGRRRWFATERLLGAEVADLRSRLDRAQMFLSSEQQIVVAWGSSGEEGYTGDAKLARPSAALGRMATERRSARVSRLLSLCYAALLGYALSTA